MFRRKLARKDQRSQGRLIKDEGQMDRLRFKNELFDGWRQGDPSPIQILFPLCSNNAFVLFCEICCHPLCDCFNAVLHSGNKLLAVGKQAVLTLEVIGRGRV